MRIGNNPAKYGLPAYTPKLLGIATVTFIPLQAGYFQDSLEVFKRMIDSIYANTSQEFDLMVIDNGSCKEVQQELIQMYRQGWITWLGLSQVNLGKTGALNWIFGALKNELICFSDSDVYFRKGWWKKTAEIMQAFPEAGMVAAQPCFYDVFEGQGKTEKTLRKMPGASFSEYRPAAKFVDEHSSALGASDELAAQFRSMILTMVEQMDSHTRAVIGSTHMQFVTRSSIIKRVLPLPANMALYREEDHVLDQRLDEMGALHLSTLEPYVVHMGNSITPELRFEMANLVHLDSQSKQNESKKPGKLSWKRELLRKISKNKSIRKRLLSIYQSLFDVVFSEEK